MDGGGWERALRAHRRTKFAIHDRARRITHGWPWDPLSPGFNQAEQPWGYGKTLLHDVETKRILWRPPRAQTMDARAVCMKSGRIYASVFGNYLTA